jgi:translation initiation factor 1
MAYSRWQYGRLPGTSRKALDPNNETLPLQAATLKPKQTFRGVVLRNANARSSAAPPGRSAALTPGGAGQQARVRVGREVAGRAGNGVSVITGLPLEEAQLESLATQLKKLCGAGGAVKSGSIEIQGDHRDRLVEALQKLGYDAKRSGG